VKQNSEYIDKEGLKETPSEMNQTNKETFDSSIGYNVEKSTPDLAVEKDEPFLIKSDKLKFVAKSSRIPVTSFSRAMNMGMLGISLLGNSLSQAFIDKVKDSFTL
jgi:hypothetical protein